MAQATAKPWIPAVPGDGPDANEASALHGSDGLAEAVVVSHGHQDPVGLELAAGQGEDAADLGPGQPIGEPVAQVAPAGWAAVDAHVRRVGDEQVDRAIRKRTEQPLGRDQSNADALVGPFAAPRRARAMARLGCHCISSPAFGVVGPGRQP